MSDRNPTESANGMVMATLAIPSNSIRVIAVDRLELNGWQYWAGGATSPNHNWRSDFGDRIFVVRQKLQTAHWPGIFPELELSLQVFVNLVAIAFSFFEQHCREHGDRLGPNKFYQITQWDPPRYKKLLEQYKAWSVACDDLIYEATRALNWFANVVRRDIDSQFFLMEGRFPLIETGYGDLSYRSNLYEYAPEARPKSLEDISKRVDEIVAKYDALAALANSAIT